MTVTRNQGEASENALTHRPKELQTTSPQPSQPSPNWLGLVLQIAQDKRHDMAAPTLRFWREKLKAFRDETVCEALTSGRWEFFPSVDQVITEIEAVQKRNQFEAANRDWEQWKGNMKRAQDEGLMATEEDYAEMRKRLREIFGDPTAKQSGRAK